jgi:hypothetical protein
MGTPEDHHDTYKIYLKEFAGSTQNHKKIIETPNLPIKVNFPKKKYV